MNIFTKTINFFKEVKAELAKVAWSTREEVLGSTFVVIVVTAIMALFIFAIDIFLSKILNVVFKL